MSLLQREYAQEDTVYQQKVNVCIYLRNVVNSCIVFSVALEALPGYHIFQL